MRKNLFTGIFFLLLTTTSLFFLSSSFAATLPPGCGGTGSNQGCTLVDTAIGPINTSVPSLVSTIFTILLGLGGGVAILLIIASGYQMMMSQGNPEKVKEARERLTSAIVGLLFMIFSATILQIIGVNILNLPGFH